MPELTSPTSITVRADDDCTAIVIPAPSARLFELIDSVTVDEFERGKQERDIHIYYKFIDKGYTGKFDE